MGVSIRSIKIGSFFLVAAIAVASSLGGCNSTADCAPSDPFCSPELFALYAELLPTTTTPGPTTITKYKSKYLFLRGGDNLLSLSLDPATGSITADNGIILGAANMAGVVTHPSGTHAIVYHSGSADPTYHNMAYDYSIGTSGALTPLGGGILTQGGAVSADFFSPEDDFNTGVLYLDDGSSGTFGLTLFDWTPGSLAYHSGGVIGTTAIDTRGTFTKDGLTLYLSRNTNVAVETYHRQSTTDSFSLAGTTTDFANGGESLIVSSQGTDLYFSDESDNSLEHFRIETVGTLPVHTASYGPYGLGNLCGNALVITPDDNYIYTMSTASKELYGLKRDQTTGSLTSISGLPLGTINGVDDLEIDPEGKFLYLLGDDAAGNAQIQIFNVNSDGTLSTRTDSPYNLSNYASGRIELVTESYTETSSD